MVFLSLQIKHKSSKGNYYITGEETEGFVGGHPFCIGTQVMTHVDGGTLSTKAIQAAEAKVGHGLCGATGCQMKVEEHRKITAIKVFCKKPMGIKPKYTWHTEEVKFQPELHKFLLKVKENYSETQDFAFVKEDGKTGADTW